MTLESRTIEVTGGQRMHCGGCERTVKFVLRQLPGVRQVEASHQTQLIILTFDTQALDLERVRQELDGIGYQVADVAEV